MKPVVIFCTALLLAVAASAQTSAPPAQMRNLTVSPENDTVFVEVDVSVPVTPRVVLLTQPDRLVLELPGTEPGSQRLPIAVKESGVKTVEVESDLQANPIMTRVVVALKEARPYGLATHGNHIVLTVLPSQVVNAKKRSGPTGAASATLIGRLRRTPDAANAAGSTASQPAGITPPPALPPITFPDDSSSSGANTSAASRPATAPRQPKTTEAEPATAPPGQNDPAPKPAAAPISQPAEVQGSATVQAAVPAQPQVEKTEAPAPPSAPPDAGIAEQAAAESTIQANPDVRLAFRVKYVAEGVAYLEGGGNDGLSQGMKLVVKEIDPSTKPTAADSAKTQPIADLEVASVALSSAVGEIHNPTQPVKVGDWAYLSTEDTQTLIAQRSLSATRKYPVVIAFSEGDTLDDEARVVIPRPPLPEINRARGRIGFDYSGVSSHGVGGGMSSSVGFMIRTDITRLGGTYWNVNGFWRGRLNHQSYGGPAPTTLQDLINRTYTLQMTYDNPHSNWVAGFGRLYLPWAPSLDAMDGGYFGRRLKEGVTLGIFGGTSPDPTSWSYDPHRQLGGAFINFEGGSFDGLRYTSTSGMGIGLLKWSIDRPFIFFENGISYKRYLSIYNSIQADSPRGNTVAAAPGPGLSRSFLNVRVQPTSRVEFDLNHTYFRDIPTFDASLVGTQLLDKYLFQGLSGGVRVEVVKNLWLYTTLGRSSASSDTNSSWNQLYGITVGRLPWLNTRTDVHYTKFNSAFGSGSYQSVSFSRNFNENLRWELLAGRQTFTSPTTTDNSHFVTGNFEATLGPHYFFQTGYTWNRGGSQNYDQWLFTFGYRFDSRSRGK